MKKFERIIVKLAIIHLVFLLISQFLLQYSSLTPYITRMIEYEGVNQSKSTEIIETFHNNN